MPKHIKIMKHPSFERYYVSDACEFPSIQKLVEYYQTNSLGVSFPGVDTTLKHPYKDVVSTTNTQRFHSVSLSNSVRATPHHLTGDAIADFQADGIGQLSFVVSVTLYITIPSLSTLSIHYCVIIIFGLFLIIRNTA